MTIYYLLTFLLLAAEMVTFCILVSPLPFAVRKRVLTFLTTSSIVSRIAYALKISFIFVGILFADALQRMYRITAESELAKSTAAGAVDVRAESNLHARKFYSQRNVYLTGFCLFLSLIQIRTFRIMRELIQTQEECTQLKKKANGNPAATNKEIVDLKKKLAERESEYDILKKQANQNAKEYDRLATEFNTLSGQKSDKRRD